MYYRVKRSSCPGEPDEWFVQSDEEEVVRDLTFKTKAEAEALVKQLLERDNQ